MNLNKTYTFLILIVTVLIFASCKKDPPSDPEFQFPSKTINKILIDASGNKWFASEKGVFSYDGQKWTTYSNEQAITTSSISDLVFNRLSGLIELYVGTNYGLSVFGFGATDITLTTYSKENSTILSNTVSAIGVDHQNIKYIGTSKGMSILKNTTWDQYLGRPGDGEPLLNFEISAISTANSGSVFASTMGGGVARFKYTDAISGPTTYKLPWAWGLPSDTVLTVTVVDTCQWYGTYKGVAYHTSEFTKSDWLTYTRADGLVCDTVYSIASDSSGDVWFGTHKGISRLSGETWTNFTSKDGLVDNKVNSVAVDLDGSLWFGTDKGISHFINNKWENY